MLKVEDMSPLVCDTQVGLFATIPHCYVGASRRGELPIATNQHLGLVGSLVEELDMEGDRILYERLTGTGPDTGWVNAKRLARYVK